MAASFAHQDLRGRSFAESALEGANFEGADLRGANFKGASLRGARLAGARTGRRPHAVILLAVAAIVLGGVAGYLGSWTGEEIHHMLLNASKPGIQVVALILSAEVLLFVVGTLWRGEVFAVRYVALPTITLFVAAGLFAVVTGVGDLRSLRVALVFAAFVALLVMVIALGAFARELAAEGAKLVVLGVILATVFGVRHATGTVVAVMIAVTATVLSHRARKRDPRAVVSGRVAENLMAVGGTSFRGADLEGANFRGARLRNTDVRGAKLDGVCWDDAVEIDHCRFDTGPLVPPRVPWKRRDDSPKEKHDGQEAKLERRHART